MTQVAAARLSAMEETRLEASTAAGRAERRNRPKHLLLLAFALLVFAAGLLGWSVLARARAAATLREERALAEKVRDITAQFNELKTDSEQSSTSRPKFGESIFNRPSRFQELAASAGLKNTGFVPQRKTADPAVNGVQRRRLEFELKDESLDALLNWMKMAVEDIPGLEVFSVRLRPEANQWALNVEFSRWERTTGT